MTLIGVVLGAENTKDRFSAASSLLDYGFANWKITVPEAPALPDLPVTGGMTDTVRLEAAAPQGVLTAVSEQGTLEIAPELPESVEAPVEKGQQVGVVRVSMNGETVEEIPVTAAESAEAITFSSAMRYLLEWFFLGAETQSGG